MKRHVARILVLAFASLSLTAHAQSNSSAGSAPVGKPPGPPPEAVAACKGKSEGTEVSFSGRNGETMTGTCRTIDGQLAAMPKGGPGGQPPSR